MQVRAVGVARALVQVIVFCDELRELRLHVSKLARREFVLRERHLGMLQVFEEGELLWQQEEQGAAAATRARRAADAMDIGLRLVGRVELYNPVDGGDVKAARGDVGAEQHARRRRAKVKKGSGALVLLLVAVEVEDGQIDVVQQLRVVLDRVARREEDDDLLVAILLEKREEEEEAVLRLADDETLLEGLDGGGVGGLLRGDVHGFVLNCQPC
mmetsp:Transcript_34488/g.90756  ORF Transcript_34488/g.90756 Transcript_34488/m.90756 type:complete len:214 (+) Transcript_34488:413-1054(+)